MIIVVATLKIVPGSEEKVFAAAKDVIAATRQEPGCDRYDLHADVFEPTTLVFVEEWASRTDLDLHFERPHMAVWRAAIAPYLKSRRVKVIHPDHIQIIE
ncbi:MAG: antibiotic biosynthesis monooxygenase [Hyphomicrobiaceae bacterium]|nr:antibiotic biosynthesis monooxygenase [Hyphomicrobiaceae bacterium]